MSAVTSRPEVRGVRVTAAPDTVVEGASLAGPLVSIGRALERSGVGSTSVPVGAPFELRPFSSILGGLSQAQDAEGAAVGMEEARVRSIQAQAAQVLSHCVAPPDHGLDAPVARLAEATTHREAVVAHRELLRAVEAGHQRVLVGHLALACASAAASAGFPVATDPVARGGVVRLVCTDASGLALVTEIYTDAPGGVSMATEVVGTRGSRCQDVLDRFDAALEASGVRAGPPRRRRTGGVCLLDGAREHVRTPESVGTGKAETATGGREARRRSTSRPSTQRQR